MGLGGDLHRLHGKPGSMRSRSETVHVIHSTAHGHDSPTDKFFHSHTIRLMAEDFEVPAIAFRDIRTDSVEDLTQEFRGYLLALVMNLNLHIGHLCERTCPEGQAAPEEEAKKRGRRRVTQP